MSFEVPTRLRAFRWPLGAAVVAMAGFFAFGAVPGLGALGRTPAPAPAIAAPLATAPPVTTSYADAVDRAAPAVVTVRVEKAVTAPQGSDFGFPDDSFLQRFFGQGGPNQGGPNSGGRQGGGGANTRRAPSPVEHGVGSGVIVSSDGRILTNNHVVDGADHVAVTLTDGREFTAKVVGKDAATDLAVIQIDAKNLPVLPLGDSDHVRVGDVVLAIGNPLDLGQTVTMGIISAKGRTTGVGDGSYEDFLQTDAPINQGNSGGALVTANGELVGINSQIVTPTGGNIGIGFAIPSNMAKNVMSQLVSGGHVRRGLLGVNVQGINSDLAESLGLSSVHGALVADVSPNGAAAHAGVQQGDVIVSIDGRSITDSNNLRNRVSALAPGTRVTLGLMRSGKDQQATATLGELTGTEAAAATGPASHTQLGMTVQPLSPDDLTRLNLPRGTAGVEVTDIDPSGVAARAGLQAGDVVRMVNGEAVHSPADFSAALARRTDRPALLFVQRGARALYLAVPRA